MKRTPLKPVSPQRAVKRAKARDLYRDCHGVAFDEVPSLLGPVRDWPTIHRVDDRDVIVRVQRTFVDCFWCNERGNWHSVARHLQLDPHHIVGGSAGRSDELTNLFPCHRPATSSFRATRRCWVGCCIASGCWIGCVRRGFG